MPWSAYSDPKKLDQKSNFWGSLYFLVCFLSLLIYRLLEQKINESATCEEIISTLREMNVLESKNEGYIPTYIRTDLTDQLHETFGFRTDTEIITINKMKKILKSIQKQK